MVYSYRDRNNRKDTVTIFTSATSKYIGDDLFKRVDRKREIQLNSEVVEDPEYHRDLWASMDTSTMIPMTEKILTMIDESDEIVLKIFPFMTVDEARPFAARKENAWIFRSMEQTAEVWEEGGKRAPASYTPTKIRQYRAYSNEFRRATPPAPIEWLSDTEAQIIVDNDFKNLANGLISTLKYTILDTINVNSKNEWERLYTDSLKNASFKDVESMMKAFNSMALSTVKDGAGLSSIETLAYSSASSAAMSPIFFLTGSSSKIIINWSVARLDSTFLNNIPLSTFAESTGNKIPGGTPNMNIPVVFVNSVTKDKVQQNPLDSIFMYSQRYIQSHFVTSGGCPWDGDYNSSYSSIYIYDGKSGAEQVIDVKTQIEHCGIFDTSKSSPSSDLPTSNWGVKILQSLLSYRSHYKLSDYVRQYKSDKTSLETEKSRHSMFSASMPAVESRNESILQMISEADDEYEMLGSMNKKQRHDNHGVSKKSYNSYQEQADQAIRIEEGFQFAPRFNMFDLYNNAGRIEEICQRFSYFNIQAFKALWSLVESQRVLYNTQVTDIDAWTEDQVETYQRISMMITGRSSNVAYQPVSQAPESKYSSNNMSDDEHNFYSNILHQIELTSETDVNTIINAIDLLSPSTKLIEHLLNTYQRLIQNGMTRLEIANKIKNYDRFVQSNSTDSSINIRKRPRQVDDSYSGAFNPDSLNPEDYRFMLRHIYFTRKAVNSFITINCPLPIGFILDRFVKIKTNPLITICKSNNDENRLGIIPVDYLDVYPSINTENDNLHINAHVKYTVLQFPTKAIQQFPHACPIQLVSEVNTSIWDPYLDQEAYHRDESKSMRCFAIPLHFTPSSSFTALYGVLPSRFISTSPTVAEDMKYLIPAFDTYNTIWGMHHDKIVGKDMFTTDLYSSADHRLLNCCFPAFYRLNLGGSKWVNRPGTCPEGQEVNAGTWERLNGVGTVGNYIPSNSAYSLYNHPRGEHST
jgi:hypothetical protein